MAREHELRFSQTELLFRRIAKYQLKDNKVKPTALRLQISVARSLYESAEEVQQRERTQAKSPKFDGVAEIAVRQARGCNYGHINVTCLDDPSPTNKSHALIALWTDANPSNDIDEEILKVRTLLSREFTLKLPPS